MIRRDLDFFPMSSEASFAYGNCSLDSEESLLRAHLLVQGQYEGFNRDHNGVFFTVSLVSSQESAVIITAHWSIPSPVETHNNIMQEKKNLKHTYHSRIFCGWL